MERTVRVRLPGARCCTKAPPAPLGAARRGRVVFTASVRGTVGVPEESAYAASKLAMVGLAEVRRA